VRNALSQRKEPEERIEDATEIHEEIDGEERRFAAQKQRLKNTGI